MQKPSKPASPSWKGSTAPSRNAIRTAVPVSAKDRCIRSSRRIPARLTRSIHSAEYGSCLCLVPKLCLGTRLRRKLCFAEGGRTRSRYQVREPRAAHFITSSIVEWLPVFTTQARCDLLVESLAHCRAHKGLLIHAARPPADL